MHILRIYLCLKIKKEILLALPFKKWKTVEDIKIKWHQSTKNIAQCMIEQAIWTTWENYNVQIQHEPHFSIFIWRYWELRAHFSILIWRRNKAVQRTCGLGLATGERIRRTTKIHSQLAKETQHEAVDSGKRVGVAADAEDLVRRLVSQHEELSRAVRLAFGAIVAGPEAHRRCLMDTRSMSSSSTRPYSKRPAHTRQITHTSLCTPVSQRK